MISYKQFYLRKDFYCMTRKTFNIKQLLETLSEIGETKAYLGHCPPEEIKRLNAAGLSVNQHSDSFDITRIF